MIAIFPELVHVAAQRDVELAAILSRRYFGGAETFKPQLKVELLVKALGITVADMRLDTFGAIVARDQKGTFEVAFICNLGLETFERQFLLAHMLGHYIFDIQPLIARGDWQVSGFREQESPLARYTNPSLATSGERRELLADEFAASLLLPAAMLTRAMTKLKTIERTAVFFGTTTRLIERRLEAARSIEVTNQIGDSEDARDLLLARTPDARREGGAFSSSLTPPSNLGPTLASPQAVASRYANAERTSSEQAKLEDTSNERESNESLAKKPKANVGRKAENPLKGMDRIREIAKRLDKR